jgi:poly(A) polymerase
MGLSGAGLKGSFRSLIGLEVRSLLDNLSSFLVQRNIESYIVGGFIRDVLLGRDTADIDIAVTSNALDVASEVAAAFGGKYVPLDEINRVGRVILDGRGKSSRGARLELDFSTFQGTIEQDLARRDFTIDAMAVSLEKFGGRAADIIIDPFNGGEDLRTGVIRAVAGTAFSADAVRLLRAVRLAAELGFRIDKKTETLIQQYSSLIAGVAGERVREELLRLLAVPGTGKFLIYLDELGLLTALFPELAEAKGVEQPREHFWNVFEHSLKTVTAVEFLLGQGAWEYAGEEVLASVPWSPELAEHFDREVSSGSTGKSMLKLAALLHDIGKPQTKALANGRIRFLGHSKEGAATAAAILERLRFSVKEIRLVETEIKYHMRPNQMSQEGLPTRRAIYRYFRDTGEAGLDILFLSLADHLATRGPNLDLTAWKEHTRLVDYVVRQHFEQKNVVQPPKIVDGYDIIRSFGVRPGPEVGEVLEAVREAQASGEVNTREEALELIGRLLTSNRPFKEEENIS